MKLVRLFRAGLRLSMAMESSQPLNFWLTLVSGATEFGLMVAFFALIYTTKNGEIAGWSFSQLLVLVSTYDIVFQLYTVMFGPSLSALPRMVRDGSLDFVLLRPIDPRVMIPMSRFGPTRLINLIYSIPVLVVGLGSCGQVVTLLSVAEYVFLILCGVVSLYALVLCSLTTAFWILEPQGVVTALGHTFALGRYPLEIFPKGLRLILRYVLPTGLFAAVPSQALLQLAITTPLLGGIATASGLLVLSHVMWKSGLRRYSGATS